MKTYLKKISALVLTVILVLSMCTAALAEGTKPQEGDSKEVTITNVVAGDTVMAYQLVDARYNENGFIGYEWTALAGKGTDPVFVDVTDAGTSTTTKQLNLSDTEVTAIASKITASTQGTTLTLDGTTGKSSEKLGVGTWLILVTGKGAKIYNPMLVSVYYSPTGSGSENGMITDELDADSSWTLKESGAYAKSSEVTIEKTVSDMDVEAGKDTVTYTINGTIPSYSTEYQNAVYTITDTVTNAQIVTNTLQVTVGTAVEGGTGVTAVVTKGAVVNSEFCSLTATETGITLEFKDGYIKELADKTAAERAVTVTYDAKITAGAKNFIPAKNDVTLTYSNNPGQTSDKKDTTYTYSFDLDGQVTKVDEKNGKLKDATFTLYRKYEADENGEKVLSDVFGTCTTGEDGKVTFAGLDAGTYYLKETAAPDGYQLTNKIYDVTIAPKYEGKDTDNNSMLSEYTVTIKAEDEENGMTGTYTVENQTVTNLLDIQNTKLSALPSTGGIGTYLFTIIGVVIMAVAAGIFFVKRRRDAE